MKYFRHEDAKSSLVAPHFFDKHGSTGEVRWRAPTRLFGGCFSGVDSDHDVGSFGELSACDIEAIGDLGHHDDEPHHDGKDRVAMDDRAAAETSHVFCAAGHARSTDPMSTCSKARYLSRRMEQLWQEMENPDREARFRLDHCAPTAQTEPLSPGQRVERAQSSMQGPKCRSCGAALDGSYPTFCRPCGDARAIHRAFALRGELEKEPGGKRNRLDDGEGFDDPIDRFAESVFADEADQTQDHVPCVGERSSPHVEASIWQLLLLFALFLAAMAVASCIYGSDSYTPTFVEEHSHAVQ